MLPATHTICRRESQLSLTQLPRQELNHEPSIPKPSPVTSWCPTPEDKGQAQQGRRHDLAPASHWLQHLLCPLRPCLPAALQRQHPLLWTQVSAPALFSEPPFLPFLTRSVSTYFLETPHFQVLWDNFPVLTHNSDATCLCSCSARHKISRSGITSWCLLTC